VEKALPAIAGCGMRGVMTQPKLRSSTGLLALALLGLGAGSGCMPINSQGYPVGVVYNSTVAPSAIDRAEVGGDGKTAPKTGRACATGILGLVAFGDASVDSAKKAGGITSIHSVEYEATGILGFIYTNACTIVHGS
jgi:hypothetical protein